MFLSRQTLTGLLWLKKVDEQIALVKPEEFDAFLNGTLDILASDPRFVSFKALNNMMHILEMRMMKCPVGSA